MAVTFTTITARRWQESSSSAMDALIPVKHARITVTSWDGEWLSAPEALRHSSLTGLGSVLGRAVPSELAELLGRVGLIGPADRSGDVTHGLMGLAKEAGHLPHP